MGGGWNACFCTNGHYVPHVSSLKRGDCEPFLEERKCDRYFGGVWGSFVCIFGVGDIKSLDKILSQTCLSALCIETVSKIHGCSAKVALKML